MIFLLKITIERAQNIKGLVISEKKYVNEGSEACAFVTINNICNFNVDSTLCQCKNNNNNKFYYKLIKNKIIYKYFNFNNRL